MEELRKMTVDGIEYNLLTDDDIEEIKLVGRLDEMAEQFIKGELKTIPSEVYDAIIEKRYGR